MIKIQFLGQETEYIDNVAAELSKLSEQNGVISARLSSKDEVRELNRRYGGQDEYTDVLSFSYIEDRPLNDSNKTRSESLDLGDIVISSEHVKSQAEASGTDEETELLLLLLHGGLHILGYDHADDAGRQQMDSLQSQIMDRLGREYRNFGWQE